MKYLLIFILLSLAQFTYSQRIYSDTIIIESVVTKCQISKISKKQIYYYVPKKRNQKSKKLNDVKSYKWNTELLKDCKFNIFEIDKFSKKVKIQSKYQSFNKSLLGPTLHLSILFLDDKYYIKSSLSSESIHSIRSDHLLIFLFNNDNTMSFNAIQSEIADTKITDYSVRKWTSIQYYLIEDIGELLEHMDSNIVTSVRVESSDGNFDLDVRSAQSDKFRNLANCVKSSIQFIE